MYNWCVKLEGPRCSARGMFASFHYFWVPLTCREMATSAEDPTAVKELKRVELTLGGPPHKFGGFHAPSTGYEWSADISNPAVVQFFTTEGTPENPDRDGDGCGGDGRDICFEFHPLSAGDTVVNIRHRRIVDDEPDKSNIGLLMSVSEDASGLDAALRAALADLAAVQWEAAAAGCKAAAVQCELSDEESPAHRLFNTRRAIALWRPVIREALTKCGHREKLQELQQERASLQGQKDRFLQEQRRLVQEIKDANVRLRACGKQVKPLPEGWDVLGETKRSECAILNASKEEQELHQAKQEVDDALLGVESAQQHVATLRRRLAALTAQEEDDDDDEPPEVEQLQGQLAALSQRLNAMSADLADDDATTVPVRQDPLA